MEKYFEVMRGIRELSDTCLEGIQYMLVKFDEGCFEQTVYLLLDVVEAVVAMEQALQPLENRLSSGHLLLLISDLRDVLASVVDAYERKDWQLTSSLVEHQLLPRYDAWKKALDRCLNAYLLY